MFKIASIYRIADPAKLAGLEELLDQAKFLPVDGGMKSFGWSPVRDGELCMKSHGHLLLAFTVEKKVIPPSAIKVALAERCAEMEKGQGFAPGKVQRREIKERVMDELAARALTTRTTCGVWLDVERGRMVIDSSATGTLDLITHEITKATDIQLTFLEHWAGVLMNSWLLEEDDLPGDYTIDDAIVMEYPGERGTLVAFKKADLDTKAVHMHAEAGAIVTQLAVTFKDRVSFKLGLAHQLKGIKLLDITKNNLVAQDADEQENNFMLMALELRAVIDSLSDPAP